MITIKSDREIELLRIAGSIVHETRMYLIPFIKVGGKCICMKGNEIEEELQQAKYAINELGGKIEKVDKFILPNSDMERNIIIIKKIKETPNRYPRKAGMPSKIPLKK